MKIQIKCLSAGSELTDDQKQVLRRVTIVLQEHNFSVRITSKVSKVKPLKLIKSAKATGKPVAVAL